MRKHQPYAEYKFSGIKWLEDVPKHWEVCRYKGIFAEREERSANGEETLLSVSAYTGVSPRSEIIEDGDHLSRAESLEGYKVCYPDDLVINIMLAWNRGLGFAKNHGIVSPAYSVFRLISQAAPRFLDYLVRADQTTLYFKAFSTGVIDSRLRLYPDVFLRLKCALPSVAEQYQIAAFLDNETDKIDNLIAKQERLIELLQEKRCALISEAVSRGLDPNAPMTDSGIEWLGKVPQHWIVKQVRHFADVVRGKFTHRPRNDPAFYDGDYPFIQTGDITGAGLYITEFKQTLNERGISVSKQFPKGTLVMAIAANIGDVAILDFPAYFPDSIVGLIPNKGTNLMFLLFLMEAMKQPLMRTATISTQMNLNVDQIVSLTAPCPPVDEQALIVKHILKETQRIDLLVEKSSKSIDLLRERRAALISAAVTGKIDVREAA